MQLAPKRGAPQLVRCDNGPEFIAQVITDWCREKGTGSSYIDPGSPWQNPWVESFNSRLRDELFAREVSLRYQPPAVFAAASTKPGLS